MNDRQRARYDSNLAVRTTCNKDANRALWGSLPAFSLLFDRVQAKVSLVNACVLIQDSDRTGLAEAKNEARVKMTASTLEIGGAVSTYGFLTGNADLQARANLNPTDLTRLPDADVDDRATAILQLGRGLPATSPGPNQPGATDVGLNPGKLDLLETRIETYNLLLGTPRAARGEKSAATANLQQALDEIDEIYEKGLDKLVEQFRGTNFYQEYQSARKIDDPGSRRRTGEPTPTPATPPQP